MCWVEQQAVAFAARSQKANAELFPVLCTKHNLLEAFPLRMDAHYR